MGKKKKDSAEKKNSINYRIQQKVQVSNSTAISVSNCLRKCAEVKNACVTFLIATFGENWVSWGKYSCCTQQEAEVGGPLGLKASQWGPYQKGGRVTAMSQR